MPNRALREGVAEKGDVQAVDSGMTCIERKVRLSGEEVVFECELLALEPGYGILRYRIENSRSVDVVRLPAGTITLALYFADRPYNLYYWLAPRDGDGGADRGDPWSRDIAYYFNIAEPLRMSRREIAYRDLAVDVLVLPDGTARVLDEEELPADLDAELRRTIDAARLELLRRHGEIIEEARRRLLPYAREL